MNCFVVVTGRRGSPVPAEMLRRLEDPAPPVLAFEPDVSHRWRSDGNRVAVAAWEADAAALEVGSRWHDDVHGVTTFSGLIWNRGWGWQRDLPWAFQLSRLLRLKRFEVSDTDRLEGIGAFASIDEVGRGVVANDPLGFGALYWAETADAFIVSSRAAVTAWLATPAGRTPSIDATAAGDMAFVSYILDDRTGFDGVKALDPGALVRIDGRGAEIERPVSVPWLAEMALPRLDLDEMVEVIGQEIRASLRLICTTVTPFGPEFELTGGKDSRLILAYLVDEGLKDWCTYFTWGQPDLPDVVVANDLMARFGLRSKAELFAEIYRASVQEAPREPVVEPEVTVTPAAPSPLPTAPAAPLGNPQETQLAWHMHATSGAISSWDQRPRPMRVSPAVAITGLVGEAMRTIHGRTASLETRDDVVRYVRLGGFGADPAQILTPEARRHHQDRMITAIDAVWPTDGTPQDAIDGFYLSQRLRRWFSGQQEHDNRNRTFPLYTMSAVRTAYSIGHRRRHDAVLPFRLMNSVNPEMARIPFAGVGSGWPAGALAGATDAHLYPQGSPPAPDRAMRRFLNGEQDPTEMARPAVPRDPETVVEAARVAQADQTLSLFLAAADIGPTHPLHGVVDTAALRSAAERFSELDYLSRRGVHDAATALRWAARV